MVKNKMLLQKCFRGKRTWRRLHVQEAASNSLRPATGEMRFRHQPEQTAPSRGVRSEIEQ